MRWNNKKIRTNDSIKLNNTLTERSTHREHLNKEGRTELQYFDPNITVCQMIQIDDSNHGTNYVHNIQFKNVQVNGKDITGNQELIMRYFGDTNYIQHISY